VLKPHNDWRAFGWLVATIVGWSIPYVTVLSMLSLRITRDLHGTSFQGAAALTAFTAAGAVGVLLGGWLGDRIGRIGTIRAGYLLALPSLAGLVLAPTPGWALACTALLGMSMFLPFAAQVTLAQDYLPRNPATASGITLGLALSVGGLVSPLFGMLSDARGLGVTFDRGVVRAGRGDHAWRCGCATGRCSRCRWTWRSRRGRSMAARAGAAPGAGCVPLRRDAASAALPAVHGQLHQVPCVQRQQHQVQRTHRRQPGRNGVRNERQVAHDGGDAQRDHGAHRERGQHQASRGIAEAPPPAPSC
jgi:MFS family permease